MLTLLLIIGVAILVSMIWNISSIYGLKKMSKNGSSGMDDAKYFELKYKTEFFKAIFSVIVAAAAYIGYTTVNDIKLEIREEFTQKTDSINQILEVAKENVVRLDSANLIVEKGQKSANEKILNFDNIIKSQSLLAKSIQEKLEKINNNNMVELNYYIVDSLKVTYEWQKGDVGGTKFYFKDMTTISGDLLPKFSSTPIIILMPKENVLTTISEVSNEGFTVTGAMSYGDISEFYIDVVIFQKK